MPVTMPFLTTYDPPGVSEGALDPLGLYQAADQLAVQLVPAVRERMQRVRFLTAIAIGALLTEGLEEDPRHRDSSPYLVWEWLLVEALIRDLGDDPQLWGVPGTLVTRRAWNSQGYLDARSYLKTARIFGFHGVYKRLATHLGITGVHLGPGPGTEKLVDVWARAVGLGGLAGARLRLKRWSDALKHSLAEKPPRTRPRFTADQWSELATALAPWRLRSSEKKYLRQILHEGGTGGLGALPDIWQVQSEFDDSEFCEEALHDRLEEHRPEYGPLLEAIRSYEAFSRQLQDAFDLLRSEAGHMDTRGYSVPEVGRDSEFQGCVRSLDRRFERAHQALGDVAVSNRSLQGLFRERFATFSESMDPGSCALALCSHHESVQRGKSAEGKRPWFDRLGPDRICVRHAYRIERPAVQPGKYVHTYRGRPIRRFAQDLS